MRTDKIYFDFEDRELELIIKDIEILLDFDHNILSDSELAFLSDNYRRYEELKQDGKRGMVFSDKQLSWLEKIKSKCSINEDE